MLHELALLLLSSAELVISQLGKTKIDAILQTLCPLLQVTQKIQAK